MEFSGKKQVVLVCATIVGVSLTLPAAADRGWGWGGFGLGVLGGAMIGSALARPYYYPPYYEPYYYAPYPTAVVVQQASPPPTTMVAPVPASSPPTWYYCNSAHAYYPYISSCPEPWHAVPAQ